jgi:tetratricopeptide (TPR) repeat protein
MSSGQDRRPSRPGGGGPRRPSQGRGASDRQRSGRPGKKKIPPPPDRDRSRGLDRRADYEAEEFEERIERVDDDRPARKSGSGKRRKRKASVDVSDVSMPGVAPDTAAKLQRRLGEAAQSFAAERFTEAEKALHSINRLAPGVPEVHELLGLTYYRLGRWVKALAELERFNELTGSVEQHPVMADCCRALKRWSQAEELWHELGEASPGPELVEEGRIVQAGMLADRGRVDDAIRFMERAPEPKGKPGVHHLRRWYMLADLYERAGDRPRARRLFGDIATADAGFGDAAERAVGG